MANHTLRVRLNLSWWVMPYLRLCRLVAASGVAISVERVKANVMRGLRFSYHGSHATTP